jgi:hypothetical protein
MERWLNTHKSQNVIGHINRIKGKNDLIISIDVGEGFHKIQDAFMIKSLKKTGIERIQFNTIKTICDKPTANFLLNGHCNHFL